MSLIKSKPVRTAAATKQVSVARTLQLSNLVRVAESPRTGGNAGPGTGFNASAFDSVQGQFKKA